MSVVRVECEIYRLIKEDRERLSTLWPVLATDEKYPTLQPAIVEIDDLPNWVGEIDCIKIKPIRKLRFVSEDIPDLKTGDPKEVREFVKTVNQVVMPGYDLLHYNSIQVLNDCCTDGIQDELNNGWRIIAIMPQLNQRRPDYVMVKKEG